MFNRPSSNFNSSKLVHVAAEFQHPVQGSWTLNDDWAQRPCNNNNINNNITRSLTWPQCYGHIG